MNSDAEIVAFCFDRRDRLVARVDQLVDTLDDDELELYIAAVARAANEESR